MLKEVEEQLYVEPYEGLFELIKWKPWIVEEREQFSEVDSLKYILQNPESIRAEYDFKNIGRGFSKGLPLQRLIALGASVETIRKVHKLYPAAMHKTTEFRTNPLHSACSYGASIKVIRYILKHNPDSIRQTNKHVFLPLHNACESKMQSPIPLEVFQILFRAYPDAMHQINKLGETPLKTAERNPTILPEVLEFLRQETEGKVKSKVSSSEPFTASSMEAGKTVTTVSHSSDFF
jgi:hypothetical protein